MPIIDSRTFDELKANLGADFIGELVDAYCTETPELIARLDQALAQGDADGFQRAAHSIKSSSASLGALEFSTRAKELEMIGKSGDLSGAAASVKDLAAGYQDVARALRMLAGLDGDAG